MTQEIKIDNTVIPFANPKFHFGQAVRQVDEHDVFGHIIGMQRSTYTWQYTLIEGSPPSNDSNETTLDEAELEAM
jgi:hypothetical protein